MILNLMKNIADRSQSELQPVVSLAILGQKNILVFRASVLKTLGRVGSGFVFKN